MRINIRHFVASLCFFACTVTHAVSVTFAFEGVIDTVNVITSDPFNGAIAVGMPFHGTYTFDTSIPNEGNTDYGVYISDDSQDGIAVQMGGYSGTSSSATVPLNYRIVLNQGHVEDIQTQGMTFGGVNAYLTQIFLKDPSLTALLSVDLSSSPPVLDDFPVRTFFLGIGSLSQADVVYVGKISSISEVPLPSAFSMSALALSMLIIFRKNRCYLKEVLKLSA